MLTNTVKGDIYCVLNGLCFLLAAAVTRHAQVATPDVFLFVRVVVSFIVGFFACLLSGDLNKLLSDPVLAYFCALNGFGTVNMNLSYLLTLNHLTTSDAYVVNRLRVVVTGILSAILCNHAFGRYSVFCTLVILCGVVLVAQPNMLFSSLDVSYNIPFVGFFIIGAAIFFGGINSVLVQLAQKNSCYINSRQFIFLFGLVGLIQYALTGFMPNDYSFLYTHDFTLVFVHVLVSFGTLIFFVLSLQNISAQRYAVVSCITIPLSYVVDALFISASFRFTSLLGALLVFVGVLLYTWPNNILKTTSSTPKLTNGS